MLRLMGPLRKRAQRRASLARQPPRCALDVWLQPTWHCFGVRLTHMHEALIASSVIIKCERKSSSYTQRISTNWNNGRYLIITSALK